MNNAKTTIFGALAAVLGFLANSTTGITQQIGVIGSSLFIFLTGASAKDASNKQ